MGRLSQDRARRALPGVLGAGTVVLLLVWWGLRLPNVVFLGWLIVVTGAIAVSIGLEGLEELSEARRNESRVRLVWVVLLYPLALAVCAYGVVWLLRGMGAL